MVSWLHQVPPWEWWGALRPSEGARGVCLHHILIPSSPSCGRIQECGTQDVPLWLFLKTMVRRSPFSLQVKTGICGLQLRADVKTQILPRSLGCSLGNDYLSQFPFLCVSLWLLKVLVCGGKTKEKIATNIFIKKERERENFNPFGDGEEGSQAPEHISFMGDSRLSRGHSTPTEFLQNWGSGGQAFETSASLPLPTSQGSGTNQPCPPPLQSGGFRRGPPPPSQHACSPGAVIATPLATQARGSVRKMLSHLADTGHLPATHSYWLSTAGWQVPCYVFFDLRTCFLGPVASDPILSPDLAS